jgi:hypothetical protein
MSRQINHLALEQEPEVAPIQHSAVLGGCERLNGLDSGAIRERFEMFAPLLVDQQRGNRLLFDAPIAVRKLA